MQWLHGVVNHAHSHRWLPIESQTHLLICIWFSHGRNKNKRDSSAHHKHSSWLTIYVTLYFSGETFSHTWPFQCWGYFCPKDKDATIFENYLNPVMLVFIGKLSHDYSQMGTNVPGFQSFLFRFLYYFVLAKLGASSIRVKNIFFSFLKCSIW